MSYDDGNIFARILRGEIPNDTVYEDDQVLAFRDISPQAPSHILVIPKGRYADADAFGAAASDAEIAALWRAVGKIVAAEGLAEDGYRLIVNCGANGGQEVPHLHIHILGGKRLGPMLSRG